MGSKHVKKQSASFFRRVWTFSRMRLKKMLVTEIIINHNVIDLSRHIGFTPPSLRCFYLQMTRPASARRAGISRAADLSYSRVFALRLS